MKGWGTHAASSSWRSWPSSRFCAVLLCACAWLPSIHAQARIQITDGRGVQVTLPRAPQRIVSLLPSLTETVCELGACDRLVGVDDYSNWPAQVRTLPHVGGLEDASVERIVALKPDVVLLGTSSRVLGRLQSLGIPVAALEPRTHADVQWVLGRTAALLGLADSAAQAEAIWRRIDAGVDAAAQSVPAASRGTRVYFEVNSAPYAAGESSFIGQTLARLGLRNIVPAALGPFPQVNPEFVVRADPELIMVSDVKSVSLDTRPGWPRIAAIRSGRVCRFSMAQGDVLVRPGPRMAEGAQIMADCVNGKLNAAAGGVSK